MEIHCSRISDGYNLDSLWIIALMARYELANDSSPTEVIAGVTLLGTKDALSSAMLEI